MNCLMLLLLYYREIKEQTGQPVTYLYMLVAHSRHTRKKKSSQMKKAARLHIVLLS